MKSKLNFTILLLFASGLISSLRSAEAMPGILIAGIEIKGFPNDSNQLVNICMYELKKLNIYDVLNQNDVEFSAKENNIDLTNCMSKQCMTQIGKALGVEKVIGGSIEQFGEKIYISFRLLNAPGGNIEKTYSQEFMAFPDRLPLMIEITLRKMHGLEVDEAILKTLTSIQSLESTLNNPKITRLNLSGPRFGFGFIAGPDAKDFRRPEKEGGWGSSPILSHFGYQFEISYLNQGNIQGLFEFLPLVSGVEYGSFIPSFTFLHGIRSNKTGLEFTIGPTFNTTRRTEGVYLDEGWTSIKKPKRPLTAEELSNSREALTQSGITKIEGGLAIGFGKSFRSGHVNFPVNAYVVLRKDSPRFGLSIGFNTKK